MRSMKTTKQILVPNTQKQIYQRQATSWNVGKVVMLIVVPNIEGDVIQWPVVRVGLVSLLKHVVLRDEVTSNWVKSH